MWHRVRFPLDAVLLYAARFDAYDLSVKTASPAVCSKQYAQKVAKKSRNQSVSDLWMAGAEGIEPSARGFGVDVEKVLHRSAFHLFQPLASFRRFTPLHFDAFLMLFAYEICPPPRLSGTQTLWGRVSQGAQNLCQRI